jgi:hypothetical protein
MSFKSEAQRRFMYARHPKIAARWSKEYDTPKNLPEKARPSVSGLKSAFKKRAK